MLKKSKRCCASSKKKQIFLTKEVIRVLEYGTESLQYHNDTTKNQSPKQAVVKSGCQKPFCPNSISLKPKKGQN